MEKISRTIDDVFEMSDSRYSLVNAISKKAREIADEAESNNDVLYRKPVNMVIDRLLDGRATIRHIEPSEEDSDDDQMWHTPSMTETTVPVYAELDSAEDNDENEAEEAGLNADAQDDGFDAEEEEEA